MATAEVREASLPTQKPMITSVYLQRVISASFGGACVVLLVTPFDVVKARLQGQRRVSINDVKGSRLNGMIDAFAKIGRKEGFWSLWRGLRPALIMQLPGSALYFPIYEVVREHVLAREPTQFWVAPVVAGLVSRTITASVVSPLELIRTNLQANVKSDASIDSNNMLNSFVNIVKRHGWKQLWGGLGPTLLRDVPFSSIYWSGFEYSKTKLNSFYSKEELSKSKGLLLDFIAGAAAGTVASVISNPMDVIKTQRQMSLSPQGSGAQTIKQICRNIIAEDGYAGFLRGMLPRTAKVSPGCAIMITSYEFCKQILIPVEK